MFKNVMMMKIISNNICGPASPGSIIIAQVGGFTSYYVPEIITKVQEIKVNYSGTFRVVFNNHFYSGGFSSQYALIQIYKNGLPYGIVRNINASGTYTEDLYFSSGDLVQLYITGFNDIYPTCVVVIYNFSLGVAEECTGGAIVTLQ